MVIAIKARDEIWIEYESKKNYYLSIRRSAHCLPEWAVWKDIAQKNQSLIQKRQLPICLLRSILHLYRT